MIQSQTDPEIESLPGNQRTVLFENLGGNEDQYSMKINVAPNLFTWLRLNPGVQDS